MHVRAHATSIDQCIDGSALGVFEPNGHDTAEFFPGVKTGGGIECRVVGEERREGENPDQHSSRRENVVC